MHYSVACLKREGKPSGSRNLGFCCTQGTTPAVNNRVGSDLFGSRQPLFAVLYYLNILICISHFLQLPSGGFQLLISLGMTEAIPPSGRDTTASPFLPPVGDSVPPPIKHAPSSISLKALKYQTTPLRPIQKLLS